jgi:dienelactone hydrolase
MPTPQVDWLQSATPFSFSLDSSGPKLSVYKAGSGPGILLLHELNGMGRPFVQLATRVWQSGFTVYAPLFFGTAGKESDLQGAYQIARLCVTREFNVLATNGESRYAPWLKALARRIASECPGKGIGAIGLCMTGNIVISLMASVSELRVPVMCEPATPFHWLKVGAERERAKCALGVPDADVDAAVKRSRETQLWAYRFDTDWRSPAERCETLKARFQGGVKVRQLPTGSPGQPRKGVHSILTTDYVKGPSDTQVVLDEILQRMHQELDV